MFLKTKILSSVNVEHLWKSLKTYELDKPVDTEIGNINVRPHPARFTVCKVKKGEFFLTRWRFYRGLQASTCRYAKELNVFVTITRTSHDSTLSMQLKPVELIYRFLVIAFLVLMAVYSAYGTFLIYFKSEPSRPESHDVMLLIATILCDVGFSYFSVVKFVEIFKSWFECEKFIRRLSKS